MPEFFKSIVIDGYKYDLPKGAYHTVKEALEGYVGYAHGTATAIPPAEIVETDKKYEALMKKLKKCKTKADFAALIK